MFERSIVNTLVMRLGSQRRFAQVVIGPRQVERVRLVGAGGTPLADFLAE